MFEFNERIGAGRIHERGYSLVAVLFVIVMLTLMGTAAYTLAGGDVSSAESTQLRSQALAAAEAGMQIYTSDVDPSLIQDEMSIVEDLVPVDLGEVAGTQYRYLIIGEGSDGTIGRMISEGQVLRDGRVVSRARIQGSVLMESFEDPYSGTAGGGPSGANLNRTGRKPFAGGPSL